MKQIKVNPNNEQFYSKEFIRGFNLGAKRQYEADIADMPKWIPCSERLPKDGRYLCDYGDCIDFGRMTNGEWYVDGVIAWMPLPEPYREEQK